MEDKHLIFIISQPRSGSTMLQALLSNNNEVGTLNEPWLLLPFLSHNRHDLSKALYNSYIAYWSVSEFKRRIGKDGFNNDLKQFLLLQYHKILKNEERLVIDKTPRYYEILDDIVNYFPNAKIIVLKRNPFAVLSSIIKTWDKNTMYKLLDYKRDLLYAPLLLQKFIKENEDNSNVNVVHYENLVKDPLTVTKDLYTWLGVEFDKSCLNFTKNIKHQGIFGDTDDMKTNRTPSSQFIDSWKAVAGSNQWNAFFKGYAEYLGEDFLKEYGDYYYENSKKTDVFNEYYQLSHLNCDFSEIPKGKFLKYWFKTTFLSFKKSKV